MKNKRSYIELSRASIGIVLAFLCIATAMGRHDSKRNLERAKSRYYYLLGAESEATGKLDNAYEYYKKAYKADTSNTDAAFSYGSLRMILKEDTFASRDELLKNLILLRSHIDKYPRDVVSGEGYAYYASMADTFPESVRVYDILVKEFPGLSRLYMPQSYYNMNVGNTEAAIKAINELERLEGATTETTLRKVSYRMADADTLGALQEINLYAAQNPGKPEPVIDKATLYHLMGFQDSALVIIENGMREFPHNSLMEFDAAMMYAEHGDSVKFHAMVAEAFNDAEEDEDRLDILNGYIKNIKYGKESYPESDRLFETAQKLYRNDARFYSIYSDYELLKKDFKATFEKSKKALELEPDNPTYLGRALSFSIVAGKPEEGVALYEAFPEGDAKRSYEMLMTYIAALQVSNETHKAIEWTDTLINTLSPGLSLADSITSERLESLLLSTLPANIYYLSAAYEVAGDLYAKNGDKKEAIRSYENALELGGDDNISVMNNYAYYLIETVGVAPGTEQFEKAKELSKKSIEATAENPSGTYYDTYAWILFKEQNFKDALMYIELAIEMEGEEVASEILSHYGDILFMLGRQEEAVEAWKRAHEKEPDNELLKKKVSHKTFFYE